MEYVRGKSLNQMLVPGVPMPLDWVADILDQLCDVLQAANDQGIIHRDLKPPNLMLRGGPPAGDEGPQGPRLRDRQDPARADADDVRTVTGSFLGTPLYTSPEQISGDPVDTRSDLYAVGVILYELLTGHRPFSGPINTDDLQADDGHAAPRSRR